jgi:ABC-2 type transport system ATP-binding protein
MTTPTNRPAPVTFTNVTRRFGKLTALDDVTLSLPAGTVIGLIGRNGSGKTTLLHHATGLVLPTSGTVSTFGAPSASLGQSELSRIGVMSQHAKLIEWMSVDRLIRYVSGFYPRWDHALEQSLRTRFELDGTATVGKLSPGNRQRLSLVLALGHHPELLLLDEPLSDLDPTARRDVLQVLLDIYEQDRPTIVISSHLLHDIEPIITRLVCLSNGRVTANEELDVLKERHGSNLEALFPILTAVA